jgi:beta-glucanase (GH16 family)
MSRRILASVGVAALALAAASCSGSNAEHAAPRAELAMHPQIAQPGPQPASAAAAESAMTATLVPHRAGRTVELQRRDGADWVKVAEGQENAHGQVDFAAPYSFGGKPAVYRVHAPAADGLGVVDSTPASTSEWGDATYSDEFAGTSLGPDWSDRLQGYSAASLRKCSKADPRAVQVAGGVLRLSVLADPDRTGETCRVDGHDYAWRINGHVGTAGKQSFTYGYAAARIKFQPLRGQHGSFWLQPSTRTADEGSAKETGAEIDVIEWFGEHDPHGGLASFIYDYPDNGKAGVTPEKVGGYLKDPDRFGSDWAGAYHVFSVEWTPSEYVFRIDGKETFRTTKGVSGRPEFLILSLLSSDYELPWLGGDQRLPQHMDVDWVRYWQH